MAGFISAILYIHVCSECDRLTQMTLRLTAQPLTLASLRRIYDGGVRLELDEALTAPLRQAQQAIDAIVAGGQVVYGINTGLGKLDGQRIDHDPPARSEEGRGGKE